MKLLFSLLFVLLSALPVLAMSTDGCGAGSCVDCHSLSLEEASRLLQPGGIDQVKKIEFAEMPGVWEVEVEKDDKSFPIYIDFSKSYVVVGNIIRLKDNTVVGSSKPAAASQRIDVERIPVDDAVLLGSRMAEDHIVVFTDPLCPFCMKLHEELKEVVRRDPNVAFLIKMFPLKMHGRQAYDLARAAVCSGSPEVLDQAFELAVLQQRAKQKSSDSARLAKEAEDLERRIMTRVCETPAVEESRSLALELGIRSTPTMIFPDGQVVSGAKKADTILQFLGRKPGK